MNLKFELKRRYIVNSIKNITVNKIKNTSVISVRVIVEHAPISERMWNKGDTATISNGEIRLGGTWYKFDDRYSVTVCE